MSEKISLDSSGNQYININLQIIKLSLFICCYLLALESCWT